MSAVTEKLMMYALGRNVQYYDAPAVRAIVRAAADKNYEFSAIVEGIVASVPFQMRTARGAAPPDPASELRCHDPRLQRGREQLRVLGYRRESSSPGDER